MQSVKEDCRIPDNILAEVHSRLSAQCGNGNGVVNRKPGVLPGENLQRKTAVEQSPVNEQLYNTIPENLGDSCSIFYRDVVERARLVYPPFG